MPVLGFDKEKVLNIVSKPWLRCCLVLNGQATVVKNNLVLRFFLEEAFVLAVGRKKGSKSNELFHLLTVAEVEAEFEKKNKLIWTESKIIDFFADPSRYLTIDCIHERSTFKEGGTTIEITTYPKHYFIIIKDSRAPDDSKQRIVIDKTIFLTLVSKIRPLWLLTE